jgi:hypothetical protein
MHWSKAPTTEALDRVNGSRGFTAAARSVLAVGDDPDGDGCHVLVVAKSNLGRLNVPALRYRIEGCSIAGADGEAIATSRLIWLGEAPGVTPRDLFAVPATEEERSEREMVRDVIEQALASGERKRSEVVREIREAGLTTSSKTVQRARQSLGIVSRRDGFGPGADHVWRLPGQPMVDIVDTPFGT